MDLYDEAYELESDCQKRPQPSEYEVAWTRYWAAMAVTSVVLSMLFAILW